MASLSGRMSSSEAVVPATISGHEFLAFDQDQLAQFMNDCRTSRRNFDISRVQGLDSLSKSQQDELSEKMR